MKKIIIPLLILAAGFFALNKFKTLTDKISYKLKGFKIVGKSLNDLKLILILNIFNPTSLIVPVGSIYFDVISNGNDIGRALINKPFTIGKNQSLDINMNVTLTPSGAGYLIAKLIKGEKIKLLAKGEINSAGLNYKIEKELA